MPTGAASPTAPPAGIGHYAAFKFVDELKRRNVFRVAVLYLIACWLILEPTHVVLAMLDIPVWANRLVVVLMAIGFPAVLVFAWVYEITPDGLRPTVEVDRARSIRTQTARRLNRAIFAVMAVALAYFVVDKFWLSKPTTAEPPATAATPIVGDRSIAVLPFADMSENKDQEYFADGMSEEIIDVLARIPAIKVIGRTSSFQFKGKNQDLRTIGSTLGVAYVLEGSVRKSGNRLRVTAQLVDTQYAAHRWSDTYDRDMGDVLKIQGEIAAALVRELEIAVGADALPLPRALKSTDAYNLYLQGRHAFDRFDKAGFEQAANYFQQAFDRDPTFAVAEAWLAGTYDVQGEWGFAPPAVAFEKARRAAETALTLDPTLAEAHAVLGSIHSVYDWDWPAADRELTQALHMAPRNPAILFFAARLSLIVGRWDDASRQIDASLALDPLMPASHMLACWIQVRRGRLPEAEAAVRRALEISPTYTYAHLAGDN